MRWGFVPNLSHWSLVSGPAVAESNGQGTGWQSFDRQFEPSNPTSARLWQRPCGVAWDAVPEPMVEFIDPDFLFFLQLARQVWVRCRGYPGQLSPVTLLQPLDAPRPLHLHPHTRTQ
jgi:hypothetical protein